MPLGNTHQSFGLVAQAIHWATALIVLALFPLGYVIARLVPQSLAEVERAFFLFSLHKTLGLVVLVLAVCRVLWWAFQPRPRPLHADRRIEVWAAQTVHWLLYVLIFLMPLTGWLYHSATEELAPIWGPFPQRLGFVPQTLVWEEFFGWAHFATAWLLAAVLALHIAGAFKHALVDRDGTLRRMIPGATRGDMATCGDVKEGPSIWTAVLVLVIFAGLVALLRPVTEQDDLVAPVAAAGQWAIDPAQSALEIEVVQNGNPARGVFQGWTGRIVYEPDRPEAAGVEVMVDIGSLSLGGVTAQALAPDYLNAAAFPVSRFEGEGFVPSGDGFTVEGVLDLGGVLRPLTLDFTLDLAGETAVAEGRATILRRDHGIGPEGGAVGPEVRVTFTVHATRAP